jgi:putative intracellular protease/amidase
MRGAGFEVVLATPKGGKAPIDPKSDEPSNQTNTSKRFAADAEAMAALNNTQKLASLDEAKFAAVFVPGGHGPMWDLAEDSNVSWIIEKFSRANKPIAAVCHGPAAFKKTPSIVKGFKVTGFTNSEEKAVGLEKIVPFSLEDALKANGAKFMNGPDWAPYTVTDNNGLLITGQNPASAEGVAKQLIAKLGK